MNAYAKEINESEPFRTSTKWLRLILDAKYKKADLIKVMKNQCQHITETQCNEFLKLLQKIEKFFNGTHDTRKTDPVDFKLKNDMKLICSIPNPVQKVHK